MAKIEKILEKNEKRLQISNYLPEECKELNSEGKLIEEDYITIKKLPYDIKIKIKFLSMKAFNGTASKELLKKYREKGHSISDLQNINTENREQIMDFMLDIDFKNIETEEMSDSTLSIERYIIDYGVDEDKHSFKDMEGKQIKLNFDTLNNFGNENLIKFVIDNIKSFSKGFTLGE